MVTKTATGLIEYAKAQLGKPYWYGTYGQSASSSLYTKKKSQYPKYYNWDYANETAKVHDCCGLIKGYLWCDSPADTTPTYNSSQDVSANGMRKLCTTSGDITSIPEVPGILVFMEGHVGIYIGNGYVIEARGHAYGVVKTQLSARKWVTWGYCPFITYDNTNTSKNEGYIVEMQVLKKGAKGEQVKTLQALLIGFGYKMTSGNKVYNVDGSFGGATERAVKEYQQDKGLVVDGSVGPKTWAKLLGQ